MKAQERLKARMEATFLLLQLFPLPRFHPLDWLAPEPSHRRLTIDSSKGTVVADLYLPAGARSGRVRYPAVIIAHAVKIPVVGVRFYPYLARSLARLGLAVLFPRLEMVETGRQAIDDPETYVAAFQYLQTRAEVDATRISFVGFSVGSSLAFIAASDSRIRKSVHALVFLGGYFNLVDYLLEITERGVESGGHTMQWQPCDEVLREIEEIMSGMGAAADFRSIQGQPPERARWVLQNIPRELEERLHRYDPASHVSGFAAPIYILDDRNDTFVPAVESEKLVASLPAGQVRAVLVTDLLQHVVPREARARDLVSRLPALHRFLATVLRGVETKGVAA